MSSENDKRIEEIINKNIILSMLAGVIPVTGLDIIAVTGIQVDMIRQIAGVYEAKFDQDIGKTIASSLAGSTLAKIGASAIKLIPGIGTVLGGGAQAVLSGASTYALGKLFKAHFSEGGDIFNFDINAVKEKYKKYFEEGKDVAKDLKEKTTDEDVFDKIAKLKKLLDAGALTEEEFNETKKVLLDKIKL